jgi:cardiolipin synthase
MRTLAWSLAALPVLLLAFIGLRYLVRGTPVARVRRSPLHDAQTDVSDPEFRRTVALLTHVRLEEGNRLELLSCGDETYPRLFRDLADAERSITIQMYYCKPGEVADRLHAVLVDRARAGVRVLFLWDAFGAQSLSREYRETLEAAGVEVAVFRPVQWYALEKAYNRSHIRVVVVDARIAYTGGFGIDDKWLGDGRHDDQWRDTNVRFTGPAVDGLQATFAAGWAEATGDLLTGEPFFADGSAHTEGDPGEGPRAEDADIAERARRADDAAGDGVEMVADVVAGVMHSAPTVGSTIAERFLALAISGTKRSLYITNAYFVPDDGFTQMLAHAAQRGADVRILTAGPSTDVRSTRYAGRARYLELLEAGVRVWEYMPTMIHAKTIVADACLGSVGTMNFDNRSMVFNDESNLIFHDARVGRALHGIFEQDLRYAREITLDAFRRRPWMERVQERVFSIPSRIL